ncbi:PEP-CTERM sorting domain-containing protein [Roseateles oligotrophus]|uniref:PEP-CTERM sorting domain-containing protein n=1 Tax=Roseateles oligotrophus TaxID=1769250 RepID=A0ABT2Y8K3_9BURK|nr:PEP-CTERM sorting domain-containing protein [Roseateles oligotrophus]MCV2366624.1 PEP-CTERM sorting domain-containing protein [Roseateles oligotrophus]
MQPSLRFLSAAALTLLSASSFAASTVYTSSADFMSHVVAGSYTENFNGLSSPPAGGAFAGGGFSYAVSAPSDLYASGEFLGTNQIDEALTITFTGGNVTAVGSNFYSTNISDQFQAVSLTITLNDGTVTTFTPTSVLDSYRGFTSNVGISSLVMSAAGASLYVGVDNLTVGVSAVPEPSSWALMGLGLAGLIAARRRTV